MTTPIVGLDACWSDFWNCTLNRVPVIRIFGSTPSGQKACLHVHGIFPYLYVPYDGSSPVDDYLQQFALAVDKALNTALGRTASKSHHVYKISLISAM
jgi:DNA polymerase zeta